MKLLAVYCFLLFSFQCFSQTDTNKRVVLVIHGGAGTILKKYMTPEKEAAYTQKMTEALEAGYSIIEAGGTSIKAVQAAINVMEDSPLFNAGKGAVYANDETQQMDASIMDGKTKNAGAVAGVGTIRNPINAAIAVMNLSEHVLLTGDGAEEFAAKNNIVIVDSSYFISDRRLEQLKRVKEKEKENDQGTVEPANEELRMDILDKKFGTVGAVALDKENNLAAGTSTGGMTNKRYNRVGDSPIIGAGTYADNKTCGVSCTGHGEYFIRNVVAYDVCALMMYKEISVEEATAEAISKQTAMGGTGGLIALDKDGNVAMPFNTAGMFRGYITENGEIIISIYED